MMQIIDFKSEYIEDALKIVKGNYEEERSKVMCLPELSSLPDISCFAENQLGVAALENNKLVGFLGAYLPINDAFGTTNVMGTFSPSHGHGATGNKREEIYFKLYQAAAEKWVKEGILSHAIAIYAHDDETIRSFFYRGFGLRCIDAVREMEEIQINTYISLKETNNLNYMEIPKAEWPMLLELNNSLILHMGSSPIFMKYPIQSEEEFIHRNRGNVRYFGVKNNGDYIAYIKISDDGENFITYDPSMKNICGAYCVPVFRGLGIYQKLLSFVLKTLKDEGYTRLGVDFESLNPFARGYWLKYFTQYTNSLVRRIDDKIIQN